MATEKNISSRIINKHDIEANWNKATNFIPKAGEIIVYDRDETYNYERFKIGDGETAVAALPFGSVQPDWNQTDSFAIDFIKNRTHYDDTRYILKTTAEITDIFTNAGGYGDNFTDNIGLPLEGVTFRVAVNDIVYNNVPIRRIKFAGSDTWGIGDRYASGLDPWMTTDYGFCFTPFGLMHNEDFFPDGIQSIDVYVVEGELKQLDPKYIKDMYYEEDVESTIVNNISVTIEELEPMVNPFSIEIIEGNVYTVTWDGTTYECTAYIAEGPNTPSIGNGFIANASGGVNEPFFITVYDGYVMLFGSETGTHTISITTMVPEIHTLDNKYLDFIDIQETQIIIPKQEITTKNTTYIGYSYCIDDKSANDFIDGAEYIVTMDEIEYKCIASVFNLDGYPYLILGNPNMVHADYPGYSGNGEPFFLFSAFPTDGVLYFVTENASTHTIEVRIDGNCKIKENYLPLLQSDWNQSDKTSGTYIKNRPFYTEKGTYIPHETSNSDEDYEIIWTYYPQPYHGLVKVVNDNEFNTSDFIGATVLSGEVRLDDFTISENDINELGNIVAIDENRLFVFVKEGSTATWTNSSGSSYTFDEGIWLPAWTYLNGNLSFSAGIQCKESIIQLDEKFIPNTIARTSDLVQPDWNQNDPSALDFIKNKPGENEAFTIAIDMELVSPVAAEDGSIYTDENGDIYCL